MPNDPWDTLPSARPSAPTAPAAPAPPQADPWDALPSAKPAAASDPWDTLPSAKATAPPRAELGPQTDPWDALPSAQVAGRPLYDNVRNQIRTIEGREPTHGEVLRRMAPIAEAQGLKPPANVPAPAYDPQTGLPADGSVVGNTARAFGQDLQHAGGVVAADARKLLHTGEGAFAGNPESFTQALETLNDPTLGQPGGPYRGPNPVRRPVLLPDPAAVAAAAQKRDEAAAEQAREAEAIGSPVVRFGANVAVPMGATIGASLLGGPVGAAGIGGTVASGEVVDTVDRRLRQQGVPPQQAMDTATQVGMASLPATAAASGFTGAGANLPAQIAADAAVGAGQDLATQVADRAITGEPIKPGQTLEAAAGGAVLSGVMRGAHAAVGALRTGRGAEPRPVPQPQPGEKPADYYRVLKEQFPDGKLPDGRKVNGQTVKDLMAAAAKEQPAAEPKPVPQPKPGEPASAYVRALMDEFPDGVLPDGRKITGRLAIEAVRTATEATNATARHPDQGGVVAAGGGQSGAGGGERGRVAQPAPVRPVADRVLPVVGDPGQPAGAQPGDVGGVAAGDDAEVERLLDGIIAGGNEPTAAPPRAAGGEPAKEDVARAVELLRSDPGGGSDKVLAQTAHLPPREAFEILQRARAEVAKGAGTEPPVPDGMVRFYHGGSDQGGARWFSPDRKYAEGYAGAKDVYYLDLPENHPLLSKSFDDTGTSTKAPYNAFEAPPELARQAKSLPRTGASQREPVAGIDGDTYPGRLKIKKSEGLSEPQQRVQRDLASLVENTEEADRRYAQIPDTRGGKVIGTDLARFLAPEYATPEGRWEHTKSTGKPASAYAEDLLRRRIEMPPPASASGADRPQILFTAGGVASGKSTAITDDVIRGYDLVSDGQMQNPDRAIREIEKALAHGWDVTVKYVQRPFDMVVRGAINRGLKSGRWGPLTELPDLHMQVQDSVAKVARHFAGNPRVEVGAILNPVEHGNGRSIEDISPFDVAEGGKFRYTDKGELERIGREQVAAARQSGRYDEARLREVAGDWWSKDDAQGTSGGNHPPDEEGPGRGGPQAADGQRPLTGDGSEAATESPSTIQPTEPRAASASDDAQRAGGSDAETRDAGTGRGGQEAPVGQRPVEPTARPSPSKAAIAEKLLRHYDEYHGDADFHEATQTEADRAPFTFARDPKTKTGFPLEVERMLEGRMQLAKGRDPILRLTDDATKAGGPDALAKYGEDRYLSMIENQSADRVRRAVEFARDSQDPEIRLLASIHDAALPAGEKVEQTTFRPDDKPVGTEATIHKIPVRIEEQGGEKVMVDGGDLPETPTAALGDVPVDKGSIKEPGAKSVLERLEDAGSAAWERFQKRNSGRTRAGIDPLDVADLAIVGAGLLAKGIRNSKAWIEAMVEKVGEEFRPHMATIYRRAREVWKKEMSADRVYKGAVEAKAKELTVPKAEGELTTIRRLTGQAKSDQVREQMAALKLRLRAMQAGARAGFKAGHGEGFEAGKAVGEVVGGRRGFAFGRASGIQETTGIKQELARLVRENLPAEVQGRLLRDVAAANTLGQLRLGIAKAEKVLADAIMRDSLRDVEKLAGAIKMETALGPKEGPPRDPKMSHPLGPDDGPLRRFNINEIDPDQRAKLRALTQQAKAIKRGIVDGDFRTIEQKNNAAADLDQVTRDIRRIVWDNKNAQEVRVRGKKVALRQAVDEAVAAVERSRQPLPRDAGDTSPPQANALLRSGRAMLNMETVLQGLDGRSDNTGAMADVGIKSIRQGQDGRNLERRAWQQRLEKALADAGYPAGSRKLRDFMDRVETVKLPEAGELKVTRNQLVSLAATLGDTSTRELVEAGVPVTFKTDPLAEGKRVGIWDILAIERALTPGEQKLIDAFREHNKAGLRDRLFRKTFELTGSAPSPTENYYMRARNTRQSDRLRSPENWKDAFTAALENISATKARGTDRKTPLLVDGFIEATGKYVDDAAQVIHLAEPVRNAATLLEHPDLARQIERRYGRALNDRIRQFLLDTMMAAQNQTPLNPAERWSQFTARQIARTVLPLNLGSFMKNIVGGTLKILPEFEAQDYAAGLKKMFDRGAYERMVENSGVAWGRYNDGIFRQYTGALLGDAPRAVAQLSFTEAAKRTAEMLRKLKPGKAFEAWGELADAIPALDYADSVPLRAAWAAAEHFVDRTMTKASPAEKLAAVKDKFHEVLFRTQNGTSSTELSGLSSSFRRSPVTNAMLMFTSDANKSLNMLAQAYRAGGAKRAKVLGAVAGNVLANSLISALLGTGLVVAGKAVGGKAFTQEEQQKALDDLGWEVGRNALGTVYFGDAIIDLIKTAVAGTERVRTGSPPDRMTDDLQEAFLNTVQAFTEAAQGNEPIKSGPNRGRGKSTVAAERAARDVLSVLSTLSGNPLQMPFNLAKRVYRGASEEEAARGRRR